MITRFMSFYKSGVSFGASRAEREEACGLGRQGRKGRPNWAAGKGWAGRLELLGWACGEGAGLRHAGPTGVWFGPGSWVELGFGFCL